MSKLRQPGVMRRITASARADDGVSIIEVLVAVLVFTLISIGIAQSLVTVIRLSADQKHRVAALSLAAGEIDNSRSYTSPFDVQSRTYDKPLDGVTYTIARTVKWVDSTGNDISCGSGSGGSLFVLSVNVEVTWGGQEHPLAPVDSSTVIAPTGAINDANHAVMLLKVTGADGFGVAGVTVSLSSTNAVGAIPTPTKTDADGCSYAVGVPPGDYTVKIQKTGYVTLASQSINAATTLVGENAAHTYKLTAGQTKSITTFIGPATNYDFSWLANGWSQNVTTAAKWPSSGNVLAAVPAGGDTVTSVGNTKPITLYPSSSGYVVVYGGYVPPDITGAGGCKAPNPHHWGVEPPVATASSPGVVGVGVVHVKITTTQNSQSGTTPIGTEPPASIVATSVTGSGSDPNCSSGATLTFASLAPGDYFLALPYGAWQLSFATATSAKWCKSGSPVKCFTSTYSFNGGLQLQTTPGTVTGTKVEFNPPASF